MGKRSTARRLAMQAIYQSEISGEDIDRSLDNLFEDDVTEDSKTFARHLARGVQANKASLDKIVADLSKNWSVDRISIINMSILKLALYELTYEKDTPRPVVINEALELAKKYSDEESAKFVNGILGSAVVK
jgi:transcription antitermination protein NusB